MHGKAFNASRKQKEVANNNASWPCQVALYGGATNFFVNPLNKAPIALKHYL